MSWTLAETSCSIPERFEAQAREHATKQAIAGTAWAPTFSELDAAANRLAAELLDRGAAPGERVALLMRHDAPLIAAQLGALKTGAAIVALNPGDPPLRLSQLRESTTPVLLALDAPNRPVALQAGFGEESIVLVPELPDCTAHPPPGIEIAPDDLAQLMCTSGSTGLPVAVMQSHRNILHNVLRHTNGLGLREQDRIVLLASTSGGQGAGTVWTTLLGGATLCPFPVIERGMTGLAQWLEETEVTIIVASASLFRHFVATLKDVRLPSVRLLRLGSERALASDFADWRGHFSPQSVLANTYSSSETGAISQHLMGGEDAHPAGRLPAGRAAEGVEILIVGEDGFELPAGQVGEIVVRGRHVSPGYWGEPELSARRFAEQPDGARCFRTGDLGRCEDGLLTVQGRIDDLVKIRGNRVSLAEVEMTLGSQAAVSGVAVLAEETSRGEMRLVAYLAHGSASAPAVADLRAELRRSLPEHSVPTSFAMLEQLPLTPHGKIDRHKLAGMDVQEQAVESSRPTPPARVPPIGETEELIAALWGRVLEREGFGRGQDFFELGGDSLAAAEVAVGLGEAFGVQIGMQAFARQPTIAGLAELTRRLCAAKGIEPERPLVAAAPGEPQPASFAQERIWLHSRVPEEAPGWVVAAVSRITGPLDVEIMRASMERLMRRHPAAIRTRFPEQEGRVLQVIDPPTPLEMPLFDLSGAADPQEKAAELVRELAREPFDLERGPLLRLTLVRLGDEEHQLFRICQHITCDGPSWKIMFAELALLYEAALRGEPPPLADELPFTYGDVAAWQRERMRPDGPLHREVLDRWRDVQAERATAPPFRRPEPLADAAPQEGTIHWGLQPPVTEGLAELGREVGATYYMVRMALYAALLAAETGDRDLLFGTYVTTRRQPETLGMFGCFTQAAAVRLSVPDDSTVGSWLTEVRAAVLEVNEHTELPYETLMEELAREGARLPGIETVFSMADIRPPLRFGGLELGMTMRSTEHYMPAGLVFQINPLGELDDCRVDFDAHIYDPVQVHGFIKRYQRLAAELCGDRDRPLRELVERSAERPGSPSPGKVRALRRWLGA